MPKVKAPLQVNSIVRLTKKDKKNKLRSLQPVYCPPANTKLWVLTGIKSSDWRMAFRTATPADITLAEEKRLKGRCTHKVIFDVGGWAMDERYCGTCGKLLEMLG